MTPTIAWSEFARRQHAVGAGNSYTSLRETDVVELVQTNWDARTPGHGETSLDRKVVVPIPHMSSAPVFFAPPTISLQVGMPVRAEVIARQMGEEPLVVNYVDISTALSYGFCPIAAEKVNVVCYSAEALLENGGTRSSDAEWEIVALLCKGPGEEPPMHYVTMARNYLQLVGGTYSDYTAEQFAKSIVQHTFRSGVKVKGEWKSDHRLNSPYFLRASDEDP